MRQTQALTAAAVFHYRKNMACVSVIEGPQTESPRLPWRAGVCLLLGLLFLYNPFFTVLTSPEFSPTIQRHVSYRSTVASSELGCSALGHSKLHISLIELLVGTEKLLLRPKETTPQRPTEESVRTVPQDLETSLWFRPPPTQ